MGDYLFNLDLSQKRAFSVAEYCLSDSSSMFTSKQLESLRKIVTANGRSFSKLIYDENGKVDAQASRRVEVKFRLKEDEMIQQMIGILEQKIGE